MNRCIYAYTFVLWRTFGGIDLATFGSLLQTSAFRGRGVGVATTAQVECLKLGLEKELQWYGIVQYNRVDSMYYIVYSIYYMVYSI